MLANGEPKKIVVIYLIEIPIYILLMWCGIQLWGVIGAALAWTIRALIDTCLLLYINKILIKILKQSILNLLLVLISLIIAIIPILNQKNQWLSLSFIFILSLLLNKKTIIYLFNNIRKWSI
jgi:O-antigen/teichoic acid export membrane protein